MPEDRIAKSGVRQRASHGTKKPPAGHAEYRRGVGFADAGRWVDATKAFEQAVRLNSRDSIYWMNLAKARIHAGDPDGGADAAMRGAALEPGSELALAAAAECLAAAHRPAEIIELLAGHDPKDIRCHHLHFQLGQAYQSLDRFQESVGCYLAALSQKPDYTAAHIQLGNAFHRLKMHEEARECFKTAIALGGDAVQLTSGMTYEELQACRWAQLAEDFPELMRRMAEERGYPQPFQLLALPSTRGQQLEAARRFAAHMYGTLEPLAEPPRLSGDGRIRVGYFSSDLHAHATAYLITEIFELHDRSRFEVTAYSYGIDDESPARQRIRQAVDHFVDFRGISDRAAAERIRADGIDILLDLKGYTLGARNAVLAFRPSPIQVNYLGYPGTLGASFYDYIIGDPIVTPLEHADGYSEKIAQMAVCYQPNDRNREIGARPTRGDCGLPEQGFVFCSFNNPYKITAEMFDIWCRLLRQVEGSVLWLFASNAQAHRSLNREAQARGIDPGRLVWAPHQPQAKHLGRLSLADLVLDTRPVCAHTTASDALWAGVPLVTCPGDSFVSRVAASILSAIDMPDLVAPDLVGYERAALALARDPQRLNTLKERLAHNRTRSALFDSARYTRDLEALYERMVGHCRNGRPAAHLPSQPS